MTTDRPVAADPSLPDGTTVFRPDGIATVGTPDRPAVVAWHTAGADRPCPRCGHLIRIGDDVAHLDTQPVVHVCRRCAE